MFQEAMRRLRTCHPDLPWAQKASHLTKFAWQLLVSGYGQQFIPQTISGAIQRYRTMLRDHQAGEHPLFRTRQQILQKKQSKAGRSASSWFLKDQVRQVLMLPATPGSQLARKVRDHVGDIVGPDRGLTKVVERGGLPVWAGLKKDDPFPKTACDFGESCLIGPCCSTTFTNYSIQCRECDPEGRRGQRAEGSKPGISSWIPTSYSK